MSLMINETAKRDHGAILFEAIVRWNNEGGASRTPAGRLMQFRVDEEANERVLCHRKKELEMRLAAAPALNSHDATEKVRYPDDLWRFSCETPDAPHLCKD